MNTTTANRKAKRAAKSRKAQATRGKAQSKSAAIVAPTVTATQTAADRIAGMGDNIRSFYTAVDTLVADIRKSSVAHAAKSDNQTLDWCLRMFEMREHVALPLLATGNASQSANDAQTTWLRSYVPAYDAAETAGKRTWAPMPDFYKQRAAEETRDAEKAAAQSIRTMFNNVVLAAYYLEHVGATNVSTAKKGRTRAVTFHYTFEGKAETATNAVTTLASNARTQLNAQREKDGKKATPQSKKRKAGTTAQTGATGAAAAPVATSETLAQSVANLSGKARDDFAASPSTDVLLCNVIAAKFEHKKSIDIGEVFKWLRTQTYFKDVTFTGHATTVEIVKPVDTKPVASAK